jgi:hypothetical protein
MAGATSTGLSVRFLILATAFGLSACKARRSRTLNNLAPTSKNSFCGGRFSGSVFAQADSERRLQKSDRDKWGQIDLGGIACY